MAELPSGTVTFLFTDLEGSTRLWQEHPEPMRPALARHDEIVRDAIASCDGVIVKTTGDGAHAAFRDASDAIAAAVAAQVALGAEEWPLPEPLRVRMGIHSGPAELRDGDYYGTTVNRAARVMAVAHGGQILCTRATVEVAGDSVEVRSLGEHRLRDLGAPQELFQVGDGSFPPVQSLDVVPTNLPTVLTELIGRTDDVERLVELLEGTRMVTLTGVGGVGKTRLALAVAAASVASFPDGVWFVELAPVNSSDEVVRATAAAIGAPVTDRAGLAGYLSDRRVLVVLDNCEHVLDQAAALAEAILVAGAEPVIIATSREPLGVDSETVRGVRSLGVPDREADDDEVAASPAVRLFVERATSAADTFALSDADTTAVVQICAQLDGIPLAIELAAARVRAMPPAEIATRLGERFRLLSAGRSAQERHRTLQAAVSWSHDLLDEPERELFRRLAVFPASFDLEAAESITGDDDPEVIDQLVHLVDQSLVQYDPLAGRYRLLETLRQYAADRLADALEMDLARERHTEYYRAFARRNTSRGKYPSLAAVQRYESELDNLHAVADWLITHARWSELLDLSRDLFTLADVAGGTDVHAWYHSALAHTRELDPQEHVDALGELEVLQTLRGQPGSDLSSQSSIEAADSLGLLASPYAWGNRFLTLFSSDPAGAFTAAQTMLTIARQRNDEFAVFQSLGFAAIGAATCGDDAESEGLSFEALDLARREPNATAFANAVSTSAAAIFEGHGGTNFAATLAFLEAHPLDLEEIPISGAVYVHRYWGLALLGTGQPDRAVPHLTRALRFADRCLPYGVKDQALTLAVALAEAGQPVLATQLDGYLQVRLADHTFRDAHHLWLRSRLDAVESTLDTAERALAHETGTQLDRRGFLRFLADTERRFGLPTST